MSLIKSNNERNGLNVTSFKNEMKETHKTSDNVSFLADGNDDIMLFFVKQLSPDFSANTN